MTERNRVSGYTWHIFSSSQLTDSSLTKTPNPKMLSKMHVTLKPTKEETEIKIGMEIETKQQVAKKVLLVKRQIASQMKNVVGEISKGEMREWLTLWTLLARVRRSK